MDSVLWFVSVLLLIALAFFLTACSHNFEFTDIFCTSLGWHFCKLFIWPLFEIMFLTWLPAMLLLKVYSLMCFYTDILRKRWQKKWTCFARCWWLKKVCQIHRRWRRMSLVGQCKFASPPPSLNLLGVVFICWFMWGEICKISYILFQDLYYIECAECVLTFTHCSCLMWQVLKVCVVLHIFNGLCDKWCVCSYDFRDYVQAAFN